MSITEPVSPFYCIQSQSLNKRWRIHISSFFPKPDSQLFCHGLAKQITEDHRRCRRRVKSQFGSAYLPQTIADRNRAAIHYCSGISSVNRWFGLMMFWVGKRGNLPLPWWIAGVIEEWKQWTISNQCYQWKIENKAIWKLWFLNVIVFLLGDMMYVVLLLATEVLMHFDNFLRV